MKMHKSITMDRVMRAVQAEIFDLDNPGFCIACGEESDGCEPDARGYECHSCGLNDVYGAEEIMMMM